MFRWIKIREFERGFIFRDRVFRRVLRPGRHWVFDPLVRVRVPVRSVRVPWLEVPDLDVIVRSGALENEAVILDLKDNERALVWVDGRFAGVCGAGLRVLWTVFHEVRVETFDTRQVRLEHPDLAVILATDTGRQMIESVRVETNQVALVMIDGRHTETLGPGHYAFWRGVAGVEVKMLDLREQAIDISGQEIMTGDKVTLRLNAVVVYRIVDPVKAVTTAAGCDQALYREAQLALRTVIGGRDLDAFLGGKEKVAGELVDLIRDRATALGLEIAALGIRDVILPGEMKAILNRVTEAKKAAEADLITRREETAAMRSQANTARIFESNPALMKLRELEVLEKVAEKANLQVVVGERGLADRIVKLI